MQLIPNGCQHNFCSHRTGIKRSRNNLVNPRLISIINFRAWKIILSYLPWKLLTTRSLPSKVTLILIFPFENNSRYESLNLFLNYLPILNKKFKYKVVIDRRIFYARIIQNLIRFVLICQYSDISN